MPQQFSAAQKQPFLVIHADEDIDRCMDLLRASAAHVKEWMAGHRGDPLDLLRRMKFDQVGVHPIEGRPLNLVEQLNQTWTYAVALAATRELLRLHPHAGGFKVAPGAHMAIPLDIMSLEDDLVGAETFAAVDPRNNRKLANDLAKMNTRPERHRYVFFSSPRFPELRQLPELEDGGGVQIWSVVV